MVIKLLNINDNNKFNYSDSINIKLFNVSLKIIKFKFKVYLKDLITIPCRVLTNIAKSNQPMSTFV